MKIILATLCLLIASMTASHADVGRYQTTNITSSEYPFEFERAFSKLS